MTNAQPAENREPAQSINDGAEQSARTDWVFGVGMLEAPMRRDPALAKIVNDQLGGLR